MPLRLPHFRLPNSEFRFRLTSPYRGAGHEVRRNPSPPGLYPRRAVNGHHHHWHAHGVFDRRRSSRAIVTANIARVNVEVGMLDRRCRTPRTRSAAPIRPIARTWGHDRWVTARNNRILAHLRKAFPRFYVNGYGRATDRRSSKLCRRLYSVQPSSPLSPIRRIPPAATRGATWTTWTRPKRSSSGSAACPTCRSRTPRRASGPIA